MKKKWIGAALSIMIAMALGAVWESVGKAMHVSSTYDTVILLAIGVVVPWIWRKRED